MTGPEGSSLHHSHVFGTDQVRSGERRTRWVILLTAVMMVAEIAAGTLFGSMALLADGWHMATHAAALGISAFAYSFARRNARDTRYTFGTGKVAALGGFGSAVSLAVVAAMVLAESVQRLWSPVSIRYDEAIAVAVLGLLVNVASAFLLKGDDHAHRHPHADHDDSHEGDHDRSDDGDHDHSHVSHHGHSHPDHNLRGAYLHVLADAVTSVMAIAALALGKWLGWVWVDAVTGIVGSVVIGRWSVGLLKDTASVLLDSEVRADRRDEVRRALEAEGDCRVVDLHLWRVGPEHLAAIVSLVTSGDRGPEQFRRRLGQFPDLAHVTVEVNRSTDL